MLSGLCTSVCRANHTVASPDASRCPAVRLIGRLAAAYTLPAAPAQLCAYPADSGRDSTPSLQHIGGLQQHVLRDGEPERLRGLQIDHEVELPRLLHRQVGRLSALEDVVHVLSGAPAQPGTARPI